MDTTTEAHTCIGVLLAGGRSSRMGRDKALLDWHGQPLIERQLAALHAAGVDGLRVGGERPSHGGIVDAQPQRGPLVGLASVAATLAGEVDVLLLPVDMPRLSGDLLRRLRVEVPLARSLCFEGYVLPWRLRLDTASRATLASLAASDEPRQRALRALQQALDTEGIALSPAEAVQLLDCNTPELWSEANR